MRLVALAILLSIFSAATVAAEEITLWGWPVEIEATERGDKYYWIDVEDVATQKPASLAPERIHSAYKEIKMRLSEIYEEPEIDEKVWHPAAFFRPLDSPTAEAIALWNGWLRLVTVWKGGDVVLAAWAERPGKPVVVIRIRRGGE